jgi:4-aminobutyrate aminotransferase
VVEAIRSQAGTLLHMSGTDFYYESMVTLAERLARTAPGDVERRVYFGNSGAEAIEAAMKLARHRTGRDKFIAFYGGFHGRTLGALSLTGSKVVQRRGFGPLIPGVYHAPYPYPYRFDGSASECLRQSLDAIELMFRCTVPAEEVAAFVVEPVQGEGGYVVPPKQFIAGLDDLARRYGILTIADEVQCGMGRTGRMWASEHFDFVPDILTSAKGIASGMPLGAMIARANLMTWRPGAHASTFGGNPVAVAASLATLDLLEEGLIDHAARMGELLMSGMREWPARFRHVGEVRGLGLMIGIEIVKDGHSRERAPELRDRIEDLAFRRGLLVLGAGPNTLRLCPPLVISEDQCRFAVETLEDCLAAAEG